MPQQDLTTPLSLQSLAADIRQGFDRVLFVVAEGKTPPENLESKAASLPPAVVATLNPASTNPLVKGLREAEQKLSLIAPVNYRKLPNMAYALFSAPFQAISGRQSQAALVQSELKPLLADCLALFDLSIASIEQVLPTEAVDNGPQIQTARDYMALIKSKRDALPQDIDMAQLLGLVDLFKNGAVLIDSFPEFSNVAGIARQVATHTSSSMMSGLAQPVVSLPVPKLTPFALSMPLVGDFSLPLAPGIGEFSVDGLHLGFQGLPAVIEGGLVLKDLYRTWSSVAALINPAMTLVAYFSGGGEYAPESLGLRLEAYRLFSGLIRAEKEEEQTETEFETLILNLLSNLHLTLGSKQDATKTSAETFLTGLAGSSALMVSGFASFGIGPIAGFLLSKTVTKCYEQGAIKGRAVSAKAAQVNQRPQALAALRNSFREVLSSSLINPSELEQFGLDKPEMLLDPAQTPLSQSYFITPILKYVEDRAVDYANPRAAAGQLVASHFGLNLNEAKPPKQKRKRHQGYIASLVKDAQAVVGEWIPEGAQSLASAGIIGARALAECQGMLDAIRSQEDPYYRDSPDKGEEKKSSLAEISQAPVGRDVLTFLFKQVVNQLNPILGEKTGGKVSFDPIELMPREKQMATALSVFQPLGALEDAAIAGLYGGLKGTVNVVKAPRQALQSAVGSVREKFTGNKTALQEQAKTMRRLLENYEKVEPVPGDSLNRPWFPEFKSFNAGIAAAGTQLTTYTAAWNALYSAQVPTGEALKAHPSPEALGILLLAQQSYLRVYQQFNEPAKEQASLAAQFNRLLAEAEQEKAEVSVILQAIPRLTRRWGEILGDLPKPDPKHLLASTYYNAQVSVWEKRLTRALFLQCQKSYPTSHRQLKSLIKQELDQAQTTLAWIQPEGPTFDGEAKEIHHQLLQAFHQIENIASNTTVAADCRRYQKEICDLGADCLVEDTAAKFATLLSRITAPDEKSMDAETAEREVSVFLQTIYQARLAQCPSDSHFKSKLFTQLKAEYGIDLDNYLGSEDSRLTPLGNAASAAATSLGGMASAAMPSLAEAGVGMAADAIFGEGNAKSAQKATKVALQLAQRFGAQEAVLGQASGLASQVSSLFVGNGPSPYQTAVEVCLRDAITARQIAGLAAEKAELVRGLIEQEEKPNIGEQSEQIKALVEKILSIGRTRYGAAQHLTKQNLLDFSEILTAYKALFLAAVNTEIQEDKALAWISAAGIDAAKINPQTQPNLLQFIGLVDALAGFPSNTRAFAVSLKQEVLDRGIAALKAGLAQECTALRTFIIQATENELKAAEESLTIFVQKYTQERDRCPLTSTLYGESASRGAYFKTDFEIPNDCYGQEDVSLGGYRPFLLGGQAFTTALEASLRQALATRTQDLINEKNQSASEGIIAQFKALKEKITSADSSALADEEKEIQGIVQAFKTARAACSDSDKMTYYAKEKFGIEEKVYGSEDYSLLAGLNPFGATPAYETALEVALRACVSTRRQETPLEVKIEALPALGAASALDSPNGPALESIKVEQVEAAAERKEIPQDAASISQESPSSPSTPQSLQSLVIEALPGVSRSLPVVQLEHELKPVVMGDDVSLIAPSPSPLNQGPIAFKAPEKPQSPLSELPLPTPTPTASRSKPLQKSPAQKSLLSKNPQLAPETRNPWSTFLITALVALVLAATAGAALPFFTVPTLLSFLITGALYASGGLAVFLNALLFVGSALLLLSVCALLLYNSGVASNSPKAAGQKLPPMPSTDETRAPAGQNTATAVPYALVSRIPGTENSLPTPTQHGSSPQDLSKNAG